MAVLRERKVMATTTLDREHAMLWLHVPDVRLSFAVPIEGVDEVYREHDAVVRVGLMVNRYGGVHRITILELVEPGYVPGPE